MLDHAETLFSILRNAVFFALTTCVHFCQRMFWFPKSTESIKSFVPLPAQLITHLSNVPPAVLLIGSLWTALAMLPAHPDISVPESLSMLAQLFVPAVVLLILLHAVRSRSEPAPAITDDASAREGYRCLFRQNESVSFIVTLIYGPKLTVRVLRSASVDALLTAVDKTWTNTHGPRGGGLLRLLTSTGKELQRGCFLADYNLHSNALLFEAPDLRGGMFMCCNRTKVYNATVKEAEARQKMEALGAKVEEDADGRVTGLDFRDVKLKLTLQELSVELPAFNKLTSIDLSGLGLTGTFPDELYHRLFSFKFFVFKGNNFDVDKKTIKGVFINEFNNIKDQTSIDLSGRGLTGPVPVFSKCVQLKYLDLHKNNLSGSIPSFEHNTDLWKLDLSGNNLSGSIPDFSKNVMLKNLYLNDNNLEGSIPSFEHNNALSRLFLQGNQLTGFIPDFSKCVKLQYLQLQKNKLSGSIPSFEHNAALEILNLSKNNLPGSVPDFSKCAQLKILFLNNNNLTGSIPSFENNVALEELHLSNNKLSGSAPSFENNAVLEYLDLSDNNLSGVFPDFTKNEKLTSLLLQNNSALCGSVTKALVMKCKGGISFSGCKQRNWNDPDADFLKFPYIVGLTFSSQDMDNVILWRDELNINDEMIVDPPPVEHNDDGDKICPWQRTWMEGLQKLRNCNIYVKSSEPRDHSNYDGENAKFGGERTKREDAPPAGFSFKEKYLNFGRFANHQNNMQRDSFDAAYALPDGERATSILDWERRIFLQVAATNNLKIVHIADGSTDDAKGVPEWYRHYPEQEAEANRIFEALEPAHRRGNS